MHILLPVLSCLRHFPAPVYLLAVRGRRGSNELLSGCNFPDTGLAVSKLGKTDVKKDLFLLTPLEAAYPARLVGVIKSRVIIYQRASLGTRFRRSQSRIMLPTKWDPRGCKGEQNSPPRVLGCQRVPGVCCGSAAAKIGAGYGQ